MSLLPAVVGTLVVPLVGHPDSSMQRTPAPLRVAHDHPLEQLRQLGEIRRLHQMVVEARVQGAPLVLFLPVAR
jgi:hypothetical protein